MFRGLEGDMCALCVVFRGDKHGTYDRDSPWSAEGSASPCVCMWFKGTFSVEEWEHRSAYMWIYDGNIGPQGTIRHYGTLVFFNWKRSFDGFFFYWRRFDAILDFVMLFY